MAYKKLTSVSFSEIYKRVPQNQMKQFLEFRDKSAEYQRRVHKFPDRLPKIDWGYYRSNVRTDYVNMVNEFEKKYEELNKVFESRDELDTSKYFAELEELKCSVQDDIDNFICESNKRIEGYEAEIERIRAMIPYEEMTVEEYCIYCPDQASCYEGKPSFWPHTPEEQEIKDPYKVKSKEVVEEEAVLVKKEKATSKTPIKKRVTSDEKNETNRTDNDKKS